MDKKCSFCGIELPIPLDIGLVMPEPVSSSDIIRTADGMAHICSVEPPANEERCITWLSLNNYEMANIIKLFTVNKTGKLIYYDENENVTKSIYVRYKTSKHQAHPSFSDGSEKQISYLLNIYIEIV